MFWRSGGRFFFLTLWILWSSTLHIFTRPTIADESTFFLCNFFFLCGVYLTETKEKFCSEFKKTDGWQTLIYFCTIIFCRAIFNSLAIPEIRCIFRMICCTCFFLNFADGLKYLMNDTLSSYLIRSVDFIRLLSAGEQKTNKNNF